MVSGWHICRDGCKLKEKLGVNLSNTQKKILVEINARSQMRKLTRKSFLWSRKSLRVLKRMKWEMFLMLTIIRIHLKSRKQVKKAAAKGANGFNSRYKCR